MEVPKMQGKEILEAVAGICEVLSCKVEEQDEKHIKLVGEYGSATVILVEESPGYAVESKVPTYAKAIRNALEGPKAEDKPPRNTNAPAVPRKGQDGPQEDFDMASWRGKQSRSYSAAGKTAPNAFAVSEEANKRMFCTQIIDSGRTKDLVWGHVRVTDPKTGQYREDRVAHEKDTFCLLKAWEDANSQAKWNKGLIIGIQDNNMPELNPDIRIKGMPSSLWLTMAVMRSWSFADRDAITKAERRAQLKMLNREWREDDEIILEQEEEQAVSGQ